MEVNLQHRSAEPMKLSYQLLKELTNCFAEERKLGSGSFGVVYKGVCENGEEIAVKVFHMMAVDDSEFQKEFQNLRGLKHQNIVELVGYCNETEETLVKHEGQTVLAHILHMALCLEYVDNGNLGGHLSDECQGLDWHLRYKIIKGICEGLKYLREGLEEPIWHLDLKPGNILLDKNMVPKIADFGLSRLFGEEKTKQTISSVGTCGYQPPEYIEKQVLSDGYDIFSLGVIIVKIMTGREGYSIIADMTHRKFVEHVHDNWRKRLQEILRGSSLEVSCEQVKRCVEIALKCTLPNRQDRPSIQKIVSDLNETETRIADLGLQIEQISQEKVETNLSGWRCFGFYGTEFLPCNLNMSYEEALSDGEAASACADSAQPQSINPANLLRKSISFQFLNDIADGFSEGRVLGRGRFGVVYKVHDNWRKKLQEIMRGSSLEVSCEQVKRCVEIALECTLPNRRDRPSIQKIVSDLNLGFWIEQAEHPMRGKMCISIAGPQLPPQSICAQPQLFNRRAGRGRVNLLGKGISFQFLNDITDGFSEGRVLGRGGFGVVYKGVNENGEAFAVKLYNTLGHNDKQFQNEVTNHTTVHHQNIVQLIGYCHETHNSVDRHHGKYILVDRTRMVLCFEYLQNGSLRSHISDECSGLEWHTRYGIIKGICEGLRYLHEGLPSPILHLNLHTSQILLDENMVPKIGNFSRSRVLDGESFFTGNIIGTIGYMPPEFVEKQVISDKYDIYSLGIIILEIMTGKKYDHYSHMHHEEIIELVVGNWRKRPQATLKDTSSVEGYYHQVKNCIEIALMCLKIERHKRPYIGDIIHMLNGTDDLERFIIHVLNETDDPELLDVQPTELLLT